MLGDWDRFEWLWLNGESGPEGFVELDVLFNFVDQGNFAAGVMGRGALPVFQGQVHQQGNQVAPADFKSGEHGPWVIGQRG